MPVLTVNTNVKSVPADFKTKATEVVAKSLGKPASYVAIHVNPGQDISFGGTDKPAALCELMSIGALSTEANKKHSAAIMALLGQYLHVESSRIYITFKNANKADIGFQDTTFAELM